MKTENENYIPFGEEWKDELMKLPKIMIINMYRNVCLELDELREQAKSLSAEIKNILNDIER
jgi:hypothetical protein